MTRNMTHVIIHFMHLITDVQHFALWMYRYMSNIAPSPFLLPVKVTLVVVDRSPQLRCDVALRSTDAITDIRQVYSSHYCTAIC
jgi:hypothetical protein